jgi:hypothetical protein
VNENVEIVAEAYALYFHQIVRRYQAMTVKRSEIIFSLIKNAVIF